jgi:cytochrome c oxidase subunit II
MGKCMLIFMILFFGFFFYQIYLWNERSLPPSASEHGIMVDTLWDWNMYLITVIFLVTNFFLFYYAYKYRGHSTKTARYFAHDNRLEMAWTVVPAIVLAFVIIFGLKYWNEIMGESEDPNKVVVEIYCKQFDFTARYPGKDGKLGTTDYRQIGGSNAVGLDSTDASGNDDILANNEFHIPVNREIELQIRSRDVIHSVYLPHFRTQMNAVPGMITYFKFKPIFTTDQMRKHPYVIKMMDGINKQRAKEGKEPIVFDYALLCNKICGASHFKMQMGVVVDSEADYKAWLAKQRAVKTVAEKK